MCDKMLLCLIDFQCGTHTFRRNDFSPGRRIGRQTTDKVINPFHRLMPINTASLFENLRSGPEFGRIFIKFFLRNGICFSFQQQIDGFQYQPSPHCHQRIMDNAHIIRIGNRQMLLADNLPRVDLVSQEKGSRTGFCISVDHRPVDRRSSPVLRKQRGMEVKRSQARHIPDNFRQHTESDDDLQVRFQSPQLGKKSLIFQFFRLEYRQFLRYGILLHRTCLQDTPMTADRLVRHRNHPYYIISALNQGTQALHRKIGSAHINDS